MESDQHQHEGKPGNLEGRVEKLEDFANDARQFFVYANTHLASIEKNMATKADLASLEARINDKFYQLTRNFYIALLSACATAITVMTFVLNYATPQRQAIPAPAPVAQQAPVVINFPAPSR